MRAGWIKYSAAQGYWPRRHEAVLGCLYKMRYMPAKSPPLATSQAQLLGQFGERLRLSRLRRGQSAEQVAARAGIARVTLHRLERGEPAVTLGTLMNVLGVLGLADELGRLACHDQASQTVADEHLPRRRLPLRIRLANYPQLRQAAWHIADPDAELTPQEAFNLYEAHWRYIDADAMLPIESALLEGLKATVGKGVMLV